MAYIGAQVENRISPAFIKEEKNLYVVDSPTPTVGISFDEIFTMSKSFKYLLNNNVVNQPEVPPPTITIFIF